MKISGFTIVRNATKLDYPVEASIRSILPLVDEMIVSIGDSDDDTEARVRSIDDAKIKIHYSTWDPTRFAGGTALADETDKALAHCQGDWCVYIQADEVLHEDGHAEIAAAIKANHSNERVEGLLLPYIHFYGSYNTTCVGRKFYRQEIRVFRNVSGVSSYRDAQGFRNQDRKLRVKYVNAPVHHYGWIRPPEIMREKVRHHWRMWRDDPDDHLDNWTYTRLFGLRKFAGTHPEPIRDWIAARANDGFDPMQLPKKYSLRYLREAVSMLIEKLTGGWRIGEWRNFKQIR